MTATELVVEADGGSRGNPGNAGYGAAVLDAGGAILTRCSGALGNTTNNVAEYRGLVAGLAAAAELGDPASSVVRVRMDSKLVVEQMSGRWRIKHAALQPLARAAKAWQTRFAEVDYEWIPRAQNQLADGLANEAMDAFAAGECEAEPLEPPVPDAEQPPAEPSQVSAGRTEGATAEAPAAPVSASTGTAATWSAATGEPLRLVLLRHGQTEYSVARRYSGHGNPALTGTGLAQAEAAAGRLARLPELAAVISSPLLRTKQTAEAVSAATGMGVEFDERLTELDFGNWEGLTFAEAAERDPEWHRDWLRDPTVPTPGGESFDQVYRRVLDAQQGLLERFGGGTVVLVSHVTPIKTLLRIGLDAGPAMLYRCHLDLAALSRVDFYPDGNASVTLVNDTGHLR